MGTYDTYHGGPISPNMDDPHIFPLEEEVLGILEDAGVPSDVYDRVVKAARKTLVEYETRIESLSAQVAELKARLSDLRRPTHGPCCTCQRCGKHYDDCRCSLDETCDDLAKAEVQVAELKKAVVPREPTEQMIDAAQAADLEGQDDPLECWRQVWLVMYDAAKEEK